MYLLSLGSCFFPLQLSLPVINQPPTKFWALLLLNSKPLILQQPPV